MISDQVLNAVYEQLLPIVETLAQYQNQNHIVVIQYEQGKVTFEF